ncbi:hypothetical protein RDp07_gp28 [Roseobacter phage RD-1410Ws-07]|uniref:Uncharacterized protein n=2 Tax=Sanyabayvirus DS1410Ws06 TaxID=2844087 RepID=A0A191VYQ3_9CAUD|nr:hypothetical protein HYO98_gp31 [Dinoroseobacter phage DS-1410Ws-06]ANJ20688.1 hypothetical protein DSp06_gp31 [Dinoroseobacter phage DS-1410Ws-06]ANJ20839.1 hypothetical protein RDp07_gp28 [Roseobacter phage RD-1410Ws-07]
MMSLLLGSVSASAIIAGGGGGYPASPSFSLLHEDEDLANTTSNYTWSWNIVNPGTYLLIVYGGTGGSGNTDSGYDSFTVDNGAVLTEIAYDQNTEYEATGYFRIIVNNAGVHNFVFDQQSQRFRMRAALYDPIALDLYAPTFYSTGTANETDTGLTASTTVPAVANQAFFSVALGRGSTPTFEYPGRTAQIMPLLESADFRSEIAFGAFPATQNEDFTVASSTTNRALVTVLTFPYLTESQAASIRVGDVLGYAIAGGRLPTGVSVENGRPYAVFGFGGGPHIRVENARPYVIVET